MKHKKERNKGLVWTLLAVCPIFVSALLAFCRVGIGISAFAGVLTFICIAFRVLKDS
ncbi:MAG: hypothetical protein PUA62_05420 [Lachnospiraceae bacterium]|nr:hypothetical protein [Lachnospiraceae bacterium]